MGERAQQHLLLELETCREHLSHLKQMQAEQRKIEAELREAEKHLRLMLDCADDYAIFSIDPEQRITIWNSGAENVFGWKREEAIGQKVDIIFTPEDRETGTVQQELQRAMREGQAPNERWQIRKDGSRFFASGVIHAMLDEDGNFVGWVKVARDTTARKLDEEERAELLAHTEAARAAAELAENQRSQFMAMVIHELRTPLTSIKGFASTLLADDVEWDPAHQREFIEIIDNETEKLSDLVNQLLDVSQIEAGTLRIRMMPASLTEILEGARPQLQAVTQAHQLVIDLPRNLPLIHADSARIAQVLVNLVQNAAKYSPEGTQIEIRATVNGEQLVEIAVRDEGEGIAPEYRATVFEAFRQLEHSDTRTSGVGLGLAICKGIVEAHGGQIWIEDSAQQGTIICFTLQSAP